MNATLTPAAHKFISRMIRMDRRPNVGFRLRVSPGGCSGFNVEFDIETTATAEEFVWETAGLRIHLDAKSKLLLEGAVVDYLDSAMQGGFAISVPGGPGACCTPAPSLVTLGSPTKPLH